MQKNDRSENLKQDLSLIQMILKNDEVAFQKLFNKYRPVVNKIWSEYYLTDMELVDWHQEASIVMLKIIHEYDFVRGVGFGCYYRKSLKNRCFDLIRRKKAQKRVPDNAILSFNDHQEFFEDILVDQKACSPERVMLLTVFFQAVFKKCSKFERFVIIAILKQQSYSEIAEQYGCSVKQVINAFERCRRKFSPL